MGLVFATVDSYAPNFRASITGNSAMRPIHLEEKPGLAGGDLFHGAQSLDQSWAVRAMLGCGDDRTPLKTQHLCDSGANPGGAVTAIPLPNAAREILRDGVKSVRDPNSCVGARCRHRPTSEKFQLQ